MSSYAFLAYFWLVFKHFLIKIDVSSCRYLTDYASCDNVFRSLITASHLPKDASSLPSAVGDSRWKGGR